MFTAAISNCERMLECLTETTTSALVNKINKKDINLITRMCLVPRRRKAYHEAKIVWQKQRDNQTRKADTDFCIQYVKKEMHIMKLQLAPEEIRQSETSIDQEDEDDQTQPW